MYWFTSDEHYGHRNILKYSKRPFQSIDEHDETIMSNHNSVVGKNDTTIHAGDLTLISNKERVYKKYIKRLKGNHIFLIGSHDYWLKGTNKKHIWEKKINGNYIVVCHYAMLTWPRSHYGSWQLYGHSHGGLSTKSPVIMGKQHDIGVDNNNYYPVSYDQIVEIMKDKPDNFNLRKKEDTCI